MFDWITPLFNLGRDISEAIGDGSFPLHSSLNMPDTSTAAEAAGILRNKGVAIRRIDGEGRIYLSPENEARARQILSDEGIAHG